MKRAVVFLTISLFIGHSAVLNAAEEEREYTAFDKFSRGIFNVLTSPFEVPITVYDTSVEENPITGLLYGFPLGIAKGGIRLCIGAVEITTFPFPPYRPLFEPEFLLFQSKKRD